MATDMLQGDEWLPVHHDPQQLVHHPRPLRPLSLLLRHQGAPQSVRPRWQVPHCQVHHLPLLLAG